MSEWWTYSLSDFLLFSPRTYYRLFELYNAAVWPGQIAALAAGAAIPVLLLAARPWSGRAVALILALAWAWVAWAFMLERYATINWAAAYLAWGFAIQAALLLWLGVAQNGFGAAPSTSLAARAGLALLAFAVVVEPLIGPAVGRSWRQAELFGLAPDPTAVATLGVVLAAARGGGWALLVLPLAWCVVGGATLWTMGSPDAPVLPGAGALALLLAIAGRRRVWPGSRRLGAGGAPRGRVGQRRRG